MWTLWYYVDLLDNRINMRGDLSSLRADPHVQEVTVSNIEAPLHEVRVTVVFREGQEQPQKLSLQGLRQEHTRIGRGEGLDSAIRNLQQFAREANRNGDVLPQIGSQVNALMRPDENDAEFRRRIVDQYLADGGRQRRLLGEALMPLRQRLDYTSVGRRVFMVDELPMGALPDYGGDPGVAAIATGVQPRLPQHHEGVSMGTTVPYDMANRGQEELLVGIDPGHAEGTAVVLGQREGSDIRFMEMSWVHNPPDPNARVQRTFMASEEPGEMWVNPRVLGAALGSRYPLRGSVPKGVSLPDWCVPGLWLARRMDGVVYQVRAIEATVVILVRYDTGEPAYWSRMIERQFLDVWRRVPDPRRTWFDRLLEAQ